MVWGTCQKKYLSLILNEDQSFFLSLFPYVLKMEKKKGSPFKETKWIDNEKRNLNNQLWRTIKKQRYFLWTQIILNLQEIEEKL